MKVLIDSNVYVSAFVKSDRFHEVSALCLEHLLVNNNAVIVSALALFEVITVLMRKHEDEGNVRMFSTSIKSMSNLTPLGLSGDMEPDLFLHGFSVLLKTSDLIMVLTAFEERAILLTWDNQMLREAKKIIRCFTPKEFLKLAKKSS